MENHSRGPSSDMFNDDKTLSLSAFMFQAIEGASEMERVHNMTLERDKTAQCLWRYALELNVFNNSGLKHRYIMFGSMIFGLWENWDQLDGAYFCFISLSSQGSSPYFRNALLEDIEEFVKQTGRLLDFSYDDYFINHFEYLINSPNHATFDSDRVIGRMEQLAPNCSMLIQKCSWATFSINCNELFTIRPHYGLGLVLDPIVNDYAYPRKCLFKDEKPEIYKDMYSYSACLVQCRIKTFLKLCRCVPESSRGLEEELQDSLDCPDCLPDCEFTRYDLKSFWTPVEAGLNKKNVCVVMLYHPTLDGVLNRLDVVTILLKPTKVLFSHKNEESGKEELRSVVAYQNPFTGDYCVHKSHPPKGYMNALPSPESTDSGVSDEYEPLKPTVGIPDSEYEKGKDYGHFNIKEHCRLASICEDNSVNKTRNWNYKEYQI
ncbi:hypothetical protein MSG28_006005 [Choristoneura fumiferana]|uniref:Uncharacterized protein n=1 Tax=Choristoneura fumiferana TaxID=7141 RepID=A0ACC0L118_CHOFU|nr:hypothetical protein MSG28_006005 [Choristoneura fumiferana]